jgi:2-polyprenyl-3-methyl-5-hydroxy-6-metoxy-1,4-benzoquinol methylase
MTEITQCPICSNADLQPHITCKDYTVTGEHFSLKKCNSCDFLMTTPRPDVLGKYYQSEDYLSHSDKSTTLFGNIYAVVRKLTISWKLRIVKSLINKSATVLDMGCGVGIFLNACKTRGYKIAGVEPSKDARVIAERNTGIKISANLEDTTGNFDLITLWHVLEHIPDLETKMILLREKLNQDGHLLIAVPNHKSHDALHYRERWAAYDVPRHLWHFSRTSMAKLFDKNQLELIDIIPMKLDSFYVSMLSEKYKNKKLGITEMIKGTWEGLISNLNSSKSFQYSSLIYIARKK